MRWKNSVEEVTGGKRAGRLATQPAIRKRRISRHLRLCIWHLRQGNGVRLFGITGVFGKIFEFFPQSLIVGIKFYSAFIVVARAVEITHFLRCVARVLVNNREIFAQTIYNRGIGIGLAKGLLV